MAVVAMVIPIAAVLPHALPGPRIPITARPACNPMTAAAQATLHPMSRSGSFNTTCARVWSSRCSTQYPVTTASAMNPTSHRQSPAAFWQSRYSRTGRAGELTPPARSMPRARARALPMPPARTGGAPPTRGASSPWRRSRCGTRPSPAERPARPLPLRGPGSRCSAARARRPTCRRRVRRGTPSLAAAVESAANRLGHMGGWKVGPDADQEVFPWEEYREHARRAATPGRSFWGLVRSGSWAHPASWGTRCPDASRNQVSPRLDAVCVPTPRRQSATIGREQALPARRSDECPGVRFRP